MENSKKLVVYYSYTGHTKIIAESIQKKLGCDILEIKPVKPYSTDYQTVVDELIYNNYDENSISLSVASRDEHSNIIQI